MVIYCGSYPAATTYCPPDGKNGRFTPYPAYPTCGCTAGTPGVPASYCCVANTSCGACDVATAMSGGCYNCMEAATGRGAASPRVPGMTRCTGGGYARVEGA